MPDGEFSSVIDLINHIDRVPLPPTRDDQTIMGSHIEEINGKRYQVDEVQHNMVQDFNDLTAFDAIASELWPGQILQGKFLTDQEILPISLDRAPGTIVLTGLTLAGGSQISKELPSPSLASADQAIQDFITNNMVLGTAARQDFVSDEVFSEEHSLLKLGMSAKWLTGNVTAALSSLSFQQISNYIVHFNQSYYDVVFQPPMPPGTVFADNVTVDDALAFMSPGNPPNPPLYISSISYGRNILFFATSNRNSLEVKASLEAAFNAFTASGNVTVDAEKSQVLTETHITALIRGGPAQGLQQLLQGQNKEQALTQMLIQGLNFSPQSPGVPIRFVTSYVRDNGLATISFAATFTERRFQEKPLMINSLVLNFHTLDDDKDDSATENIEIFAGTERVFSGAFVAAFILERNHLMNTWEDNTTAILTLPLTHPVPFDSVGQMAIRIFQTRDNTGWHMSYDILAVLDDGSNRLVANGRKNIGDDDPEDTGRLPFRID
jgi:hypothetical protein